MVGCPLFDYQPFTGVRRVGHGLTLGQLETYLLWGYKRAVPGLLKNEKPPATGPVCPGRWLARHRHRGATPSRGRFPLPLAPDGLHLLGA